MSYLGATRHPWICFLFLVPLLLLYEGGVFWLSSNESQAVRNGADAWLRWGLEHFGIREVLAAPGFVIGFLVIWSFWRWDDRPQRTFSTLIGMALESILLAIALRSISVHFNDILRHYEIQFDTLNIQTGLSNDRIAQIITFVGAGIYEEVVFRLVLFAGLAFILRIAFVPGLLAIPLAAIVSSLLFAGAHHVGPYGETFQRDIFLFRVVAGLFFTLIYWLRGFGVAVGAHTAYDLVVGINWDG